MAKASNRADEYVAGGRKLCVATIGQPHGVRGALTIRCHLADPMAIDQYGPLSSDDGRTFLVRPQRLKGKALIATIKGVVDRNGAEALRGLDLYINRDQLPAPAPDEFYHADLIGLAVRDVSGQALGDIVAVQNFGGGDLLEIRLTGMRKTIFVPFTMAAVPTIDIAAGRVLVDLPDGLIDDNGPADSVPNAPKG